MTEGIYIKTIKEAFIRAGRVNCGGIRTEEQFYKCGCYAFEESTLPPKRFLRKRGVSKLDLEELALILNDNGFSKSKEDASKIAEEFYKKANEFGNGIYIDLSHHYKHPYSFELRFKRAKTSDDKPALMIYSAKRHHTRNETFHFGRF